MNKNELAERIVDALLDPWNDPDDYYDLDPITVEYAKDLLADIRETEQLSELSADERLPEETTPELVQEVMNCLIRWRSHQHRIDMLAKWLTDNECVCIYDQYRSEYLQDSIEVLPTDILCDMENFPFGLEDAQADIVAVLTIGKLSARTFNPNLEYCWFDKDKWQLHSTNTPFADGIIDANALATYAIESGDKNILEELEGQMDDDLFDEIFNAQ